MPKSCRTALSVASAVSSAPGARMGAGAHQVQPPDVFAAVGGTEAGGLRQPGLHTPGAAQVVVALRSEIFRRKQFHYVQRDRCALARAGTWKNRRGGFYGRIYPAPVPCTGWRGSGYGAAGRGTVSEHQYTSKSSSWSSLIFGPCGRSTSSGVPARSGPDGYAQSGRWR